MYLYVYMYVFEKKKKKNDIESLVQDCSNSSVLVMDFLLSCTKPSMSSW